MESYRISAWITFLFLLSVAAVAQLTGPTVPDDRQFANCVQNLRLTERFGTSLSCDSTQFVWLSGWPVRLLDPDAFRQSRPGIVFITFLLEKPIKPLVQGVEMPLPDARPGGEPYVANDRWTKRTSIFIAYFVVNIVILAAAFWLLLKTIEPLAPAGGLVGIGIGSIASLLAANEVTKMFLWSPHTQLFNIFVPVFTIAAAMSVLRAGLNQRRAIAIGLVIGIGMLTYPVFPIAFAVVMAAALLRPSRSTALNLAVLIAYSVVPYLIWYAVVRVKTGGFYAAEVHTYNQVSWMVEAWRNGDFLSRLAGLFWLMVKAAAEQSHVVLLMLAIAGAPVAVRSIAMTPSDRTVLVPVTVVSMIVVLLGALFYAAVGLTINRTAYIMIPPLIVTTAAAYAAASRNMRPSMKAVVSMSLLTLAVINIAEIAFHRVVWE